MITFEISKNLRIMSQINVKFLDVGWTYSSIKEEIDSAVENVLKSGSFVLGEESFLFEKEFAQYVGAVDCIGVASGLDALFLSLKVLGVSEGDEVIVPAHTFIATWLAVTMCGAKIVPAEVLPLTHNIDPEDVASKITERTKAIIPVHLYGLPADLLRLNQISKDSGVPLIEDAAQCHGATFDDRPIGASDACVAWSFYPGKNLGAFGDGGAISTNDSEIATKLRTLRNYGSKEKYIHLERGFNSRLDEIQAAILRVKLRHLDQWNARRKAIAEIYDEQLKTLPLVLPIVPTNSTHAYHLYVVEVADRDDVRRKLLDFGIETGVHYPTPIYQQIAYQSEFQGFHSVETESLSASALSLPIGPHLTESDALQVCAALLQIFKP
jgi:dTDP-4-amino-4,6-dideoxygalactose transaminase